MVIWLDLVWRTNWYKGNMFVHILNSSCSEVYIYVVTSIICIITKVLQENILDVMLQYRIYSNGQIKVYFVHRTRSCTVTIKKCHHFWSLAHFDLRNISSTLYFVHRTRSCTVTIKKWIWIYLLDRHRRVLI